MDNFTLAKIAQNCCATSRAKFSGVWSADNFGLLHCSPPQSRKKRIRKQKEFNGDASKLLVQSYFIVNTSRAGGLGKHWLLLLLLCQEQQPPVHREKQNLMFCVWDPLGKPIKSYLSIFNHLQEVSKQSKFQKVRELWKKENPLSVKTGVCSILNGFRSPLSNSQFEFFQLFVEGFR